MGLVAETAAVSPLRVGIAEPFRVHPLPTTAVFPGQPGVLGQSLMLPIASDFGQQLETLGSASVAVAVTVTATATATANSTAEPKVPPRTLKEPWEGLYSSGCSATTDRHGGQSAAFYRLAVEDA